MSFCVSGDHLSVLDGVSLQLDRDRRTALGTSSQTIHRQKNRLNPSPKKKLVTIS